MPLMASRMFGHTKVSHRSISSDMVKSKIPLPDLCFGLTYYRIV